VTNRKHQAVHGLQWRSAGRDANWEGLSPSGRRCPAGGWKSRVAMSWGRIMSGERNVWWKLSSFENFWGMSEFPYRNTGLYVGLMICATLFNTQTHIWLGTRQQLAKLNSEPLQLKGELIMHLKEVRDLGVVIDSELNMDAHARNVVRSCFYQFHICVARGCSGCTCTPRTEKSN